MLLFAWISRAYPRDICYKAVVKFQLRPRVKVNLFETNWIICDDSSTGETKFSLFLKIPFMKAWNCEQSFPPMVGNILRYFVVIFWSFNRGWRVDSSWNTTRVNLNSIHRLFFSPLFSYHLTRHFPMIRLNWIFLHSRESVFQFNLS